MIFYVLVIIPLIYLLEIKVNAITESEYYKNLYNLTFETSTGLDLNNYNSVDNGLSYYEYANKYGGNTLDLPDSYKYTYLDDFVIQNYLNMKYDKYYIYGDGEYYPIYLSDLEGQIFAEFLPNNLFFSDIPTVDTTQHTATFNNASVSMQFYGYGHATQLVDNVVRDENGRDIWRCSYAPYSPDSFVPAENNNTEYFTYIGIVNIANRGAWELMWNGTKGGLGGSPVLTLVSAQNISGTAVIRYRCTVSGEERFFNEFVIYADVSGNGEISTTGANVGDKGLYYKDGEIIKPINNDLFLNNDDVVFNSNGTINIYNSGDVNTYPVYFDKNNENIKNILNDFTLNYSPNLMIELNPYLYLDFSDNPIETMGNILLKLLGVLTGIANKAKCDCREILEKIYKYIQNIENETYFFVVSPIDNFINQIKIYFSG